MGMKFLILSLVAVCLFTVGCTSSHHHDHGTVGDGMGGQTMGTSFPTHHGAGADNTHGPNVRQNAPTDR